MKGIKNLQNRLENLDKEIKKDVTKAIAGSLIMVENDARLSIMKGPKTGRIYPRPGGKTHQASAPGESPANDTGRLVSHINHEIKDSGLSGTVGIHNLSSVPYARRLEFGGKDSRGIMILPRPYLFKAYNKNEKSIKKKIAEAIVEAVRRG